MLLFSRPLVSDSLRPHGLQDSRPSCPSASPGVCPSWCYLHWRCHPAISSSDALFSFCPWSFPASGTFPKSRLFTSDDQNTGAASVLSVNIQVWSPLRLTRLISLLSKGLSGVFSSTQFKGINSLAFCLLYGPALRNRMWPLGQPLPDYTDLCWQSHVSAFQHSV